MAPHPAPTRVTAVQPGDYEIVVTQASLLTHASHVEDIAADVDVARQAAVHVRLDGGAYGMICAFVPGYLNGLSDGLMGGLDGAVTSLRDTGSRLRAAAALFAAADSGAEIRVDEVGQ